MCCSWRNEYWSYWDYDFFLPIKHSVERKKIIHRACSLLSVLVVSPVRPSHFRLQSKKCFHSGFKLPERCWTGSWWSRCQAWCCRAERLIELPKAHILVRILKFKISLVVPCLPWERPCIKKFKKTFWFHFMVRWLDWWNKEQEPENAGLEIAEVLMPEALKASQTNRFV